MNREEVIEVLTNALDGLGTAWIVDEAISAAIELLAEDNNVPTKQPDLEWVKTAGRLPPSKDGYVLTRGVEGVAAIMRAGFVVERSDAFPYWMPIPPLPEVEE